MEKVAIFFRIVESEYPIVQTNQHVKLLRVHPFLCRVPLQPATNHNLCYNRLGAANQAVTVIENAPEAAFTMSMVSFNTHSSRVINESSLPLAVPSFSSSASQPLLTSMSIKTLQLPGVDLPEVGDAVETASGKVRVLAAPLLQIALLDSDFEEAETNLSGLMIFRTSKEAVDAASCTFLTDEGWSDEGLHLASREEIKNAFGEIDTWDMFSKALTSPKMHGNKWQAEIIFLNLLGEILTAKGGLANLRIPVAPGVPRVICQSSHLFGLALSWKHCSVMVPGRWWQAF